jgi:hypothetical protein
MRMTKLPDVIDNFTRDIAGKKVMSWSTLSAAIAFA